MASLLIKNTTGAQVDIDDMGTFIPASTTITFEDPGLLRQLSGSADLATLLTAGTLVITDGTTDYALTRALEVVRDAGFKEGLDEFPSRRTARGSITGARLTFATVATVTIGTSGVTSQMRDSTDALTFEFSGTLSVDITASGAGGLDTGSEAADTWYAVYVIADSFGNNSPAGLFSTSATTPTLPTGYDVFRRIGWVRNDSGSDFIDFFQVGNSQDRWVYWSVDRDDVAILQGGSATVRTTLDASSFVPPTSRLVILQVELDTGATGEDDDVGFWIAGELGAVPAFDLPGNRALGVETTGGEENRLQMLTQTNEDQEIDYEFSTAAAGTDLDLMILAWMDEL